jgi:hypothetical protein
VSSCLSKIFTHIINQRLGDFCDDNDIIPCEQIGFCKGHGTTDHIFVLKTIIDLMKRNKKTLYCAFIDFSKAFDSIWHLGLLYKLLQMNIGSTFIKLLKNMYSRMKARVKQSNTLSTDFAVQIGTKQGCNISHTLFKMYLWDLPTTLLKDECDPILMDNTKVSCLLYADDLVIISQIQSGLQHFKLI